MSITKSGVLCLLISLCGCCEKIITVEKQRYKVEEIMYVVDGPDEFVIKDTIYGYKWKAVEIEDDLVYE